EQRPRPARDLGDECARLAQVTILVMSGHHRPGIELLKRFLGDVEPGNDAPLLGQQTAETALVLVDDAFGRDVAPPHVLGEGPSDEFAIHALVQALRPCAHATPPAGVGVGSSSPSTTTALRASPSMART